MKYLDMPAGNDLCDTYNVWAGKIAQGKSVAAVAVTKPDGNPGMYVYSARPAEMPTTKEASYQHCLLMCARARRKAEEAGYIVHP